jgi:hypothetical protein
VLLSGANPLRQVIVAGAVMLAAGCSGHPATPSPGEGTHTATLAQSYQAGVKAGEGIVVPSSQTLGQRLTRCEALAGKRMPAGDVSFEWIEGCTVGSYLGKGGGSQSPSAGP